MSTSIANHDEQLKAILIGRAMGIVHDELEDTLNKDAAARRWHSTNTVMRRQLFARPRDIVEPEWNPVGSPGLPEFSARFRDLVSMYRQILEDQITHRMNSGVSPHTSEESGPGSDGSDDSESEAHGTFC
ncbi:hypothetical protein NLJ89_g3849 [Agrocybe chaxingu]|uniref:Uncharacterized protein n=1 Tax=Agrocybe chaxingu TaxID=84603 RepID=A0A9W8K4Y9_9AGAR|nr:hypothetical protein NLJ89_g3849 [Agrocybe chaxingu]